MRNYPGVTSYDVILLRHLVPQCDVSGKTLDEIIFTHIVVIIIVILTVILDLTGEIQYIFLLNKYFLGINHRRWKLANFTKFMCYFSHWNNILKLGDSLSIWNEIYNSFMLLKENKVKTNMSTYKNYLGYWNENNLLIIYFVIVT